MNFEPDKCIKCGVVISQLGKPKSCYNEVVFLLSNGSRFFVGISADCDIDPSEYPEVMSAMRDYQTMLGAPAYEDDVFIVNQVSRQTLPEVLFAVQAGNCAKCGKPLCETYVQTNGRLQHESCELPEKDRIALLAEIESLKAQLNGGQ